MRLRSTTAAGLGLALAAASPPAARSLAAQGRPGSADPSASCEPPIEGVRTVCGFVDSGRGYRLRTIVTIPDGATRRRPAILFVQWLSCDAVTLPAEGGDGVARLLRGLIQRSEMVFARTEKPGLGESGGPACGELGYDEELAAHRAALAALRRSAHVHPDSIFVFGASMGGTMAPLVALGERVRGVLVAGSTGLTWAEHMIALDRRVLRLRGTPPDSVHALMGEHALFHGLYLGGGMSPARVVAERPALAAVWRRLLGTDSTYRRQYGRPIRFHHEAQRANWAGAWAALDAPVLVVGGEYDWIMDPQEHRAIIDAATARRPGRAELVIQPRMDHGFLVHNSPEAAFRGRGGTWDPAVLDVMLGWLGRQR